MITQVHEGLALVVRGTWGCLKVIDVRLSTITNEINAEELHDTPIFNLGSAVKAKGATISDIRNNIASRDCKKAIHIPSKRNIRVLEGPHALAVVSLLLMSSGIGYKGHGVGNRAVISKELILLRIPNNTVDDSGAIAIIISHKDIGGIVQ